MHIIGAQILSLTSIFVSMISVFLLPYWWVGRRPESFDGSRYQLGLSLANCLSGGVFIATFFVGLMPEVRIMFIEVLEEYKIKSEFPVTEFVIFIGFLLALGIEQYVLDYRERNTTNYTSVPSNLNDDANKSDSNNTSPTTTTGLEISESHALDYDSDAKPSSVALKEVNPEYLDHSRPSHRNGRSHGHSHGGGHSHTDIGEFLQGEAGIRLGMLMVSMGVHSLFEGLALGLQTSVTTLVNLVIGVAVHELLVAFAMGVNVSRLKLRRSTALKLAVVFSASIPLGQIVGLLIGHYHSTAAVAVSAVLQGLAAGTFIHVTFLEVIPAEFQESGLRVLKVFFLGLGFMLLLVCTITMQNITHHKR